MVEFAKRPTTLVEAVLIRPKMYTMSGSFGEVIAFLTAYMSGYLKGFAFGEAAGKSGQVVDWPDIWPAKEWREIELNLCAEYGVPTTGVFEEFLRAHNSDAEATRALLAITRDYFDSLDWSSPEAQRNDVIDGGADQATGN